MIKNDNDHFDLTSNGVENKQSALINKKQKDLGILHTNIPNMQTA